MKTQFTVDKEFIKEAYNSACPDWKDKLKNKFPQAFESELEIGKWYKFKSGTLGFFNGYNKESYGFHTDNNQWFEDHRWFFDYNKDNYQNCILATDKEVETALIAEAKRRGFKEGTVCLVGNVKRKTKLSENNFKLERNLLCVGVDIIFKDGKWAEIISEPIEVTLEQIAEKFNVNVEQLKIKK